jgi:hypothetical protein
VKEALVHHPLPDPVKVSGTEAQKLEAYRAVRDRIAKEIPAILANK